MKHGFKSIILVTSFDHMPRACFLQRLMLLGSDVRVQIYKTGEEIFARPFWSVLKGEKLGIYNEMIDMWGSICECAQYIFNGDLSEKPLGATAVVKRLKSILLFKPLASV